MSRCGDWKATTWCLGWLALCGTAVELGTEERSSLVLGGGSTLSGCHQFTLVGHLTLLTRCVDLGEDIIVTVYQLRRLFPDFMRLPIMSKTVALPVMADTMVQARYINQELRNLVIGLEVGFEVVGEGDQVKVNMDYEGADMAKVVKFLKKVKKF